MSLSLKGFVHTYFDFFFRPSFWKRGQQQQQQPPKQPHPQQPEVEKMICDDEEECSLQFKRPQKISSDHCHKITLAKRLHLRLSGRPQKEAMGVPDDAEGDRRLSTSPSNSFRAGISPQNNAPKQEVEVVAVDVLSTLC